MVSYRGSLTAEIVSNALEAVLGHVRITFGCDTASLMVRGPGDRWTVEACDAGPEAIVPSDPSEGDRVDVGPDLVLVVTPGGLTAGDRSVLVVTVSHHRAAAFEAASFLMDYLKTRAPFWKRDLRQSGEKWVDARDSDDAAAARWAKE